MKKRQRKSIQQLFEKLRNESQTNINQVNQNKDANESIISLEDSTDSRQGKRKADSYEINDKKRQRARSIDNVTEIKEFIDLSTPSKTEVPVKFEKANSTPSSPICSTPKTNKKRRSNNELNISNVSPSSNVVNFNNNLDLTKSIHIEDLTKEINRDSYLTIDLTSESEPQKSKQTNDTVIDLDKSESDCTLVFANSNLSMSGDSEVNYYYYYLNIIYNYCYFIPSYV